MGTAWTMFMAAYDSKRRIVTYPTPRKKAADKAIQEAGHNRSNSNQGKRDCSQSNLQKLHRGIGLFCCQILAKHDSTICGTIVYAQWSAMKYQCQLQPKQD
mmetsp:Transcript_9911/g.21592  ORF Transcript_9911/g.21592 Transcript_9911/m.21592 type:complete len:101 (-) Transcript_9911:2162-2464(-)